MPPIEGLEEQYAENETIKRYEDVNALAKGLIETKSLIGDSIRIPSEDASDEDVNNFNTKLMERAPNLMLKPNFDDDTQSKEFFRTLGMPNSHEDYEMPEFEAPEGVEVNVSRMEGFKAIAHKYGLTKDQYSNIVKDFMSGEIDSASTQMDSHKAAMSSLKEEWGMATNDRIASALLAAEASGAPQSVIDSIKGGNASPDLLKWMYSVGSQIGEETTNFARKKSMHDSMSPNEAQQQLSEIRNNKDHPYNNPEDPSNAAAIKKVVMLSSVVAGEKFDEKAFDSSFGRG